MTTETSNNTFKAVVIGALALVLGSGITALVMRGSSPILPAAPTQPSVVVQPLVTIPQAVAPSGEQQLGGLVHNIQETFDQGIAVNGSQVIGPTGSVSGTNFIINGNVTSTSVVTDKVCSFTSSASSQVLCSIRNTTGADRVIDQATIAYTTSSVTGGTFNLSISQSATANATGTGANIFYNDAITVPTNGVRAVNATSTLSTGKAVWVNGSYINVLVAAPTSTLTGTVRVTSY